MPVIPESSDFPSAPQKGGNESEKKQTGETNPAFAAFNSKGPQIPDLKGKWTQSMQADPTNFYRLASQGFTRRDRGTYEGTQQAFQLRGRVP